MKSTKVVFDTIDEYIAAQPLDKQKVLKQIRSLVKKHAPKAIEKISYGMPGFYLNGNLIWFAAAKEHYGIYPEPDAIVFFKDELKNFKTSKGAIQFPADEKIPVSLLTDIIKYRVKKNNEKIKMLAKKK